MFTVRHPLGSASRPDARGSIIGARQSVAGPGVRVIRRFLSRSQAAKGAGKEPPAGTGTGTAGRGTGPEPEPALWREAEEFIRTHHGEQPALGAPDSRLAAVRREIRDTGTYRHTQDELTFGARLAWRNSNRCIGRLYWRSLRVRDLRRLSAAEQVAEACADHLRLATNGGRIRPLISVFAPDAPERRGPRIWNEQLIRYAGYRAGDGRILGDPRSAGITELALSIGRPGGSRTAFDVLPLIVEGADDKPRAFELPPDAVLEVPLIHPGGLWGEEWGLRWHAVPAMSAMCLEIGGICYPAAPFNGWYMGTEIGARDLADTDRYDMLPRIAALLGLDTSTDRSLWKDRALVELNLAVLHSFDGAGVTMADHHTESVRFLRHMTDEARKGREVHADWSWIVPPMSGATTPVFHRTYDAAELRPRFVQHPGALARTRGESIPR